MHRVTSRRLRYLELNKFWVCRPLTRSVYPTLLNNFKHSATKHARGSQVSLGETWKLPLLKTSELFCLSVGPRSLMVPTSSRWPTCNWILDRMESNGSGGQMTAEGGGRGNVQRVLSAALRAHAVCHLVGRIRTIPNRRLNLHLLPRAEPSPLSAASSQHSSIEHLS